MSIWHNALISVQFHFIPCLDEIKNEIAILNLHTQHVMIDNTRIFIVGSGSKRLVQ